MIPNDGHRKRKEEKRKGEVEQVLQAKQIVILSNLVFYAQSASTVISGRRSLYPNAYTVKRTFI